MARHLARLQINTIVKAFILAEMLLWSGWNFIMPIFSIYVAKLPDGSIEKAASSFSFYLFTRVIFGLLSGKLLTGKRDRYKLFVTVLGMCLLSLSYVGLAFASSMHEIYYYYIVIGIALGIATPAKTSLFSANLNKQKETFMWGVLDAGVYISMAIAAAIGGIFVGKYGFRMLFFLAAFINLTGIFPYLIYLYSNRKRAKIQPARIS
jgi:MFS family permease